jgi:hypothetical protein
LLPGVSVNASGKRRIFDEDDVIHVAVMAQLVRLGLASPIASEAAAFARGRWNEPNAMLAIGPAEEEDRLSAAELQYYVYSSEEANKIGPDKLYGWRERPEGYVIVSSPG